MFRGSLFLIFMERQFLFMGLTQASFFQTYFPKTWFWMRMLLWKACGQWTTSHLNISAGGSIITCGAKGPILTFSRVFGRPHQENTSIF